MNNVSKMGTKFWGFCAVLLVVGVLALFGKLSPEAATLISGLGSSFFGFQKGRTETMLNGHKENK